MKKVGLPLAFDRVTLDGLYTKYNRREFVQMDPLRFVYAYDDPRDREVAAFIASSLAFGNVPQIVRSVSRVLQCMPSPYEFLRQASLESLRETFSDFKHRWVAGDDVARALSGVKRAIERHGSLHECFLAGLHSDGETVWPALAAFAAKLAAYSNGGSNCLIPSPMGGSACKRLNLFLRWMVRRDEVDPGGWDGVPRSKLLVPLDTHIYRFSIENKLTERKQADMRAALEVTAAFKAISPEDPVRYDFALTHWLMLIKESFPRTGACQSPD